MWVGRTEVRRDRPLAVFGWLADWYGRDGERGCAFLNAAAEVVDVTDPARVVIAQEKCWLAGYLVELARDAGLWAPDRLGSQLLLLIDGVAARVLVHGVQAAFDAVADATEAARGLITAAGAGGAG